MSALTEDNEETMYRSATADWLVKVTFLAALIMAANSLAAAQTQVDGGLIQGETSSESGVRVFKGIPFAAPPVGDLRWREPHPVTPWKGVRKATEFGARCMQGPIYGDMIFRDNGPSEDCLYLNVWTPAKSPKERLPVMVWIYGGGFQAGASSEPRQDGEKLAKKGVIVVSLNYRLGVFGFLAHPELSKESGHNASGNYGLMDQAAALEWVKRNIEAFGGDPSKVTIFGESAGSFSVSALMASPMSRALFQGAIGESGAFFSQSGGTLSQKSPAENEHSGAEFGASIGANSIAELRAKPANEVLQSALKAGGFRFAPGIDGYFLPTDVSSIYAAGKQSHVPLLAGWNADEARAFVTLAKQKPTVQTFSDQMRKTFKGDAQTALKLYPATSDQEALESAASFASDSFIGYVTWKWIEMQYRTGQATVYRYSFDKAPPVAPGTKINGVPATSKDIGARHAGEIEYVFGALKSIDVPWEPGDWKVSELMMSYWTNFAKTGNPNGPGLPTWPTYDKATGFQVMHLNIDSGAAPDRQRPRFEFLDRGKEQPEAQ
jgi:para-nitrobenzyl esterase